MASPSVYALHSICVFARATPGKNPNFFAAANHLGVVLAANRINLVYGGGSAGLMGLVATSAFLGEVKVLGVIPRPLAELRVVGPTVGDELKISNIQDRMISMMHNADAFIALLGGFGTLELFQVVAWDQMNIHRKPIGLLNVDGFYDGLLAFVDSLVEIGFISPNSRRIIMSANTVEELLTQFHAYQPLPDPILSHINWTGANDRRKRKMDLTLTL
ncbi:hypothetical protein OROMI_034454 [Orobanche minor]